MRKIAALYVDPLGPYPKIPGVDAWDEARDARTYDGPYPVVAHPPCGPWGSLRHLAKGAMAYRDCAIRAVAQVRAWGGVLEHPRGSALWDFCGLEVEQTVQVEQVSWGHVARKPTRLYFVGINRAEVLAEIRTGGTPSAWISGTYTPGRRGTVPPGIRVTTRLERRLTPPAFAEWLVSLARRAKK